MKFDKGMKRFYADIGNAIAYRIKPSHELDGLIKDGNPKPLREWLKNRFGESGFHDSDISSVVIPNRGLELEYNFMLNNLDEHTLSVSWSQLATLLRDNDFRKKYIFPNEQPDHYTEYLTQWEIEHNYLCGNYHAEHCEFLFTSEKNTVLNGKKLGVYCAYCTSENKIRKINHISLWSGISPKFCPKRRALEEQQSMYDTSAEESAVYESEKEDTKMTPNFNFKGFISEGNQLKQVPLDMLVPYHNHKFKLYEGERLDDMVNSIKENGVLTPIIVRNIGGEHYEILAGHNRTNAARIAGLSVIPAIVKENLSDDEAEMYVIETNVMQRGFNDLSISERATVIAARHSAMFDEDKRRAIERELAILNGDTPADEGEEQDGEKKSKLAAVGESYGLSKDSVARLIRIDKLSNELKSYVDSGEIPIRAGVNLSYLLPNEQRKVAELMGYKMDMKKSALLRELSRNHQLTDNVTSEVMINGEVKDLSAPVPRKPIKVKISTDIVTRYFPPNWDENKVQEIVELALEQYFTSTDRLIMDENDEYQI